MDNSVKLLAYKTDNKNMLDAFGKPIDQLKLIELAGRTCYKSNDKITDDSAKQFVSSLIKSGHEAMIEFSWLTFRFPKDKYVSKWLIEMLKNEISIKVTESDDNFLVSGNFRNFRDMFRRIRDCDWDQKSVIYLFLLKNHPEIIEGVIEDDYYKKNRVINLHDPEYWYNNFQANDFYELPDPLIGSEILKHYWVAAKFIGSRAFTHQLVRHRLSSFAQESQRYCDESGFLDNEYFIIPPSFEEVGIHKLFVAHLNEVNSMHQKLLNLLTIFGLRGKKLKEDARFILPNAVASEICMASNLEQWFRVFKFRLDPHAQWEIRRVIEELQRQIYNVIPEAESLYENYITQKGTDNKQSL